MEQKQHLDQQKLERIKIMWYVYYKWGDSIVETPFNSIQDAFNFIEKECLSDLNNIKAYFLSDKQIKIHN